MSFIKQLHIRQCEKNFPKILQLPREYGKYAIYFDLVGHNTENAAEEIAILFSTGNEKFQKYLQNAGLEIGMVIRKPKRSFSAYQAAGYAIIKRSAQDELLDEINYKMKNIDSIGLEHGVPLSHDANIYIEYLITQQRRKSVAEIEEFLNKQLSQKITIGRRDVDSSLYIFQKK